MRRSVVGLVIVSFMVSCTGRRGGEVTQEPGELSEEVPTVESVVEGRVPPPSRVAPVPSFPSPEETTPLEVEGVTHSGCMSGLEGRCVQSPMVSSWVCPMTWNTFTVEGGGTHSICQPPHRPVSCAGGKHAYPGVTQCVTAGDDCDPSGWPAALPASGEVLYVQSGGTGSGASASDPLGSIQVALSLATEGAVIAIHDGQYNESLLVAKDVTLRGNCSEKVSVVATASAEDIAMTISSPATVENLGLESAGWGVLVSDPGGTVELKGVVVDGVKHAGLTITGASSTVRVEDSAIRNTTEGRGLTVDKATLVMKRVTIEDVHVSGLHAIGATLVLEDILVKNVRASATPTDLGDGSGIHLTEGSSLQMDRAWIDNTERRGMVIRGQSDADLSYAHVVNTTLDGVRVENSSFIASQLRIKDVTGDGLSASGSTVDLNEFFVSGLDALLATGMGPNSMGGASSPTGEVLPTGVFGEKASTLSLSDGVIWDTDYAGVYLSGTNATLEDIVVEDTGLLGVGGLDFSSASVERTRVELTDFGIVLAPGAYASAMNQGVLKDVEVKKAAKRGLDIENSSLIGRRLLVEESGVGILARGERSLVQLEQVEVSGARFKTAEDETTGETELTGGIGLVATQESRVYLADSRFENNDYTNMYFADAETFGDLKNVSLRDAGGGQLTNASQEVEEYGGFGVMVDKGALVEMDQITAKNNASFGMIIHGVNSQARVKNMEIRGNKGKRSDGTSRTRLGVQGVGVFAGGHFDGRWGRIKDAGMYGVVVDGGGSEGDLQDFSIQDTMGTGVHVANKASVSIADSLVSGSDFSGVVADGDQSAISMNNVTVKLSYGRKGALDATSRVRLGEEGGDGLALTNGASGEVESSLFYLNERCGVGVADGASSVGSSLAVNDLETVANEVGMSDNSKNFDVGDFTGRIKAHHNVVSNSMVPLRIKDAVPVVPGVMEGLAVPQMGPGL